MVSSVGVGSLLTGMAAVSGILVLGLHVSVVTGIVTAVLTTLLITLDYAMRSAMARTASRYFYGLKEEWKDVWWNQHRPDVVQRMQHLESRVLTFPDIAGSMDNRLNDSCTKTAEIAVSAEYDTAMRQEAT